MDSTSYWRRQEPDKPLFPEMEWNRPENKMHAGKLLVIGGNKFGFNAPAEAYTFAMNAGVGIVRTLLPNALEKTMGKLFPEIEFAPSTPSGSFGRPSLAEMLDAANWADGVLLAGDFGKNAETTIVIEALLQKYQQQLLLCGDAVDQITPHPQLVLDRACTTLILEFTQLQKLAIAVGSTIAITSSMDFLHFLEALHVLSSENEVSIIVEREGSWFVAVNGQVTSTKSQATATRVAASASVWLLQNPQKSLEALTTALV